MPESYLTSYCNQAHRVKDGKPVDHECRMIPPAALQAEMDDQLDVARQMLESAPRTYMRKGVTS